MPFAQTNGFDTYYESYGQGEPLLLIPGRGLDRTSWAPQVECYSRYFTTISYDPRGVGKTRAPDEQFDVTQMADDARALLAALSFGAAHIIGFSLGGMAAIHLASADCIKVLSLGLHSTVHRAYAHLRLRQKLSLRMIDCDDVELWPLFSAYSAFGAEFINAHPEIVENEIARRIKRMKAMTPAEKAGLKAQIRAAMTHDAADLLGRIRAPTLVTVGSSDDATRPEYAREIATMIPNAQVVIFEGGPHRTSTFMADEFNRVTLDFLLQHSQRDAERPPG